MAMASQFLSCQSCVPSCCFIPRHISIDGEIRFQKSRRLLPCDSVLGNASFSAFCSRLYKIHARKFHRGVCRAAQHHKDVVSDDEVAQCQSLAPPLDVFGNDDGWQWRKTTRELAAYAMMFAAVPLGSMLPHLQYSGAFYFVFLAVWSVYVGSHRSLQKSPPQKMSFKQGLAVPIMCSLSLFGFYSLLRFFPDLDLRTFISIYLGFAGSIAVASNLAGPVRYILSGKESFSWRINIPQWLLQDEGCPVHVTITVADCIALLVGVGAAFASKQAGAPFTLNNFVAVCIVTELLNLLSLGSFMTAAAMLGGLLLYDVFWVFGSPHVFGDNVMLTVATSTAFEGPMKLIFPNWSGNPANMYSVLGLGDVAAPGLLIALMLRFDRSRSRMFNPDLTVAEKISEDLAAEDVPSEKPDKTYFVTCIAAYLIGLAVTIGVNSVSGAAQPALLYLVPSLLVGVYLMASYRSEASLLLDFKDEVPAGKE